MRQLKKIDRFISALIIALFLCGNVGIASADDKKPYSKEDPIWLDFDMESIPEPKSYETGYLFDMANGTFFQQAKQAFDFPRHYRNLTGNPKKAYNVNSLGEVPDSSWFTNRNGRKRMTIEEIKRGPNKTNGPAAGKLTVVKAKTRGVQPGLWVKDESGETYILKFDPPDYPELASTAEVVSTKLLYAIGYNVPENSIFRFSRDQLQIEKKKDDGATQITEADIESVLKRVGQQPDGRYRCVASKLLEGKVKGNFTFLGVQNEDPNDIIPHEHRRDLRGLRVFCAWLNHIDIRTENTINLYVTENERKFIRHYLVDFGATLGSYSTRPKPAWAGHEYNLDAGVSLKQLVTLGTYPQPWLEHKQELKYPSVGNYESKYFEAEKWKQFFPLVAFENMTGEDAYWASKVVGSFTDEQIQAVVETAELSDPEAARYLAQQLINRRDKIVREYYRQTAAIDRFNIDRAGDSFVLRFSDLRNEIGIESGAYEFELRSAGEKKVLDKGSISKTVIILSPELLSKIGSSGKSEADRGVAKLTIRRKGEERNVDVYLYYNTAQKTVKVVGVEL